MPGPPCRFDEKASTLPFGDQVGSSLLPWFWVTRVSCPFERSRVTMSKCPDASSRAVYARTRAPGRGDHAGVWFHVPTVDTRRWFEPSAPMMKICGLPSRFDTKAISEPSGEKAGEVSM